MCPVSPRYPSHNVPVGLEPERPGSSKKKDDHKEPSITGRRREAQQFHGNISKIIASQPYWEDLQALETNLFKVVGIEI